MEKLEGIVLSECIYCAIDTLALWYMEYLYQSKSRGIDEPLNIDFFASRL